MILTMIRIKKYINKNKHGYYIIMIIILQKIVKNTNDQIKKIDATNEMHWKPWT